MTRKRALTATALVVLLAGLFAAASVQAAPGDLDPTFSGDGKQLTSIGVSASGNDVVLQADGKIVVVGGSYAGAGGTTRFALTRFTPDGSLDPSFDADGQVTTESGNVAALAVALEPDGKIVAAGGQTVARYLPDGSLDTSFGVNGKVSTDFGISDVKVSRDGRMIVAGYGAGGMVLARYNSADGSPDVSFDGDGKVTSDFNGGRIALQADGKIVAVGSAPGFGGYGDLALARYNADGSPDRSFGVNGEQITDADWGADDALADVAIGPDGTIATVGQSYCFICSSTTLILAVYTPDGSPWALHMTNVDSLDSGSGVAIQSDGKIVAVGATAEDFLVARYDSAGNPDPSFHDDGIYTNLGVRTTDFGGSDGAGGVVIQPDGKLLTAGTSVVYGADGSGTGRIALARYEAGSAPVNLRPPTISGTAAQGQTLTAIPGGWSATTGPSSYQWLTCGADGTGCANIAGATANTYLLSPGDVGRHIAVRETATNANGQTSVQSAVTTEVSGNVVSLRPPAIAGTATEGQTLTVTPGTWSTTNNITRTIQWRQCDRNGANCLDIAGASSASYVLLATDVGHTIRVRETAKNAWSQSSVDSDATSIVSGKAPVNSTPPAITGNATEGLTLTAIAGAWTGSTPMNRGYQWRRCDSAGGNCVGIAAASTLNYTLSSSDVGHTIRVRETATTDYGTGSIDSAATGAVKPKPGIIAGMVTDNTKNAIAGARVDCGTAGTATTNATGAYSITTAPPGRHTCAATATGYRAQTQNVTVSSGTQTTANFRLVRT